jgi:hypothetical protein
MCAAQQPTDGAIFPRNTARESAVVDASKGYTPLNSCSLCLLGKLAFAAPLLYAHFDLARPAMGARY